MDSVTQLILLPLGQLCFISFSGAEGLQQSIVTQDSKPTVAGCFIDMVLGVCREPIANAFVVECDPLELCIFLLAGCQKDRKPCNGSFGFKWGHA